MFCIRHNYEIKSTEKESSFVCKAYTEKKCLQIIITLLECFHFHLFCPEGVQTFALDCTNHLKERQQFMRIGWISYSEVVDPL